MVAAQAPGACLEHTKPARGLVLGKGGKRDVFCQQDCTLSSELSVQKAMECVRGFAHRLFGAYEKYARDANEAWLNAIESGLVRQVGTCRVSMLCTCLAQSWCLSARHSFTGML